MAAMRTFLLLTSTILASAHLHAEDTLEPRADVSWQAGNERSILLNEFWVPLQQSGDRVFYADFRLMDDDKNNSEFNAGLGYRQITCCEGFGKGVAGAHAWLDRRQTALGSTFMQMTLGAEWLTKSMDYRVNAYVPFSKKQRHRTSTAAGTQLAGTGINVNTPGLIQEEPQYGLDIEAGYELGYTSDWIRKHTDSFRVYGGLYYFDSSDAEKTAGWRTRTELAITPDFQIGTIYQKDDQRGDQGFLEATLRFPFKNKQRFRSKGLYARLDDSPERDIDIVAGTTIIESGLSTPLINDETGTAQEIIHVDNTAAGGGDGSVETPFNTLADARAAASAHSIIYVHTGAGTGGQNQGIALNLDGLQLIGAGSNFTFDADIYRTGNGFAPNNNVLITASTAPTITNINADSDGITISADNVRVSGLNVTGATRDGILVEADGAGASAQNVEIENVTVAGNRHGIYVHGLNDGAASVKVEGTVAAGNTQHGIAIYDDTNSTFDVDLGGGTQNSAGLNTLAGNTMEDLAIEYDGRTLSAQNNWWGQATGADEDAPNVGIDPQIYYGAPINDGLVSHHVLSSSWISSAAYDRVSGDANTLVGGLSAADVEACGGSECLQLDAQNDHISIDDASHLPTSDMTIMTWVEQPNLVNWYDHVSNNWNAGANPNSWNLFVNGAGRLVFGTWGVQTGGAQRTAVTANSTFAAGQMNLITGTYDGTTYRASVNASGWVDRVEAGITHRNDLPVRIGELGQPTTNDYYIREVRFYDRALGDAEVTELYRMDTTSSVDGSNFRTSAP